MARRPALPGLSPQLRRHERRRLRRPAGRHPPPRPSRAARRHRRLAEPDPPVAESRLGLRRRRLHGCPPRARNARRLRRARRRGRETRDPDPARPRPEPHLRRAPLVPGRARLEGERLPRLLRLGGCGSRWRPTQQLGLDVRRVRLVARSGERAVLPAQLHEPAARPELVERGAARGVRPHPPLLARARRRRLPRRRLPWDRQGPAAARQPARDRRRSPERACPGPAGGLQHEPPRGARRAAPLAFHLRRVRRGARRRDGHLRPRAARHVLRRAARQRCDARRLPRPRLQLPLPARAVRGGGARAHDQRDRGAAAGLRPADLDALEPRLLPRDHPLGRRRRPQAAPRADAALQPARHAAPLLRRRARSRGRRGAVRADQGSARVRHAARQGRPRSLPHADALEPGSRRRLLPGGCRAMAPVRVRGCPWRPRAAARPVLDHALHDRACASARAQSPTCAVPGASPARPPACSSCAVERSTCC